MQLTIKLILGFFIITLFVILMGFYMIFQLSNISESISEDIPIILENIQETSELDGLAQLIRYYDEVLTQSVRNYAYTGDKQWEDKYNSIQPQLAKIIATAIEKGDEGDRKIFSMINDANIELVNLEYHAIELVNEGGENEAISILESSEYLEQKQKYDANLEKYISMRGFAHERALETSFSSVALFTEQLELLSRSTVQTFVAFILIIIALTTTIAIYVSQYITKPILELRNNTKLMSLDQKFEKIPLRGADEITDLGQSINDMMESLRETEIKKGEFASMVSHELKTPLVPIKGHAEMLIEPGLMGNLNEQQFESISAIYANSVRLESLINDVLDVHKLEIGKIKFVYETIEIKPFMEQIFKSYYPIFHEKNITMLNNTSEKTVFINSDSFRLTQVLSNLLENTIDFVPIIDGVVEIGWGSQ